MKPRTKVVTAQDVESSLFYCHVDSLEDESLREGLQSGSNIQRLSEMRGYGPMPWVSQTDTFRPNSNFHNTQHEVENTPRLLPRPTLSFKPPNSLEAKNVARQQSIRRKPVGGSCTTSQSDKPANRPPSPQKPSGPRPLKPKDRLHEASISQDAIPGKENINPRRWSEQPPQLPPRQDTRLGRNSFESGVKHSRDYQVEVENPFRTDSRGFSVTLIRRDPTSGGQWNVGKIAGSFQQSNETVQSEGNTSGNDSRGILLEIANPGYDKFLSRYRETIENGYQGDRPTPFQRRLHLSQPKPQSQAPAPRRNGFRSSVDFHRRSSVQSLSNPQNPAVPDGDTPRPFSFLSPWNGICEFTTGVAGRSLKCKHSLGSTSPYSPTTPNVLGYTSTVSELRFNLPSNNMVTTKHIKRPPLSTGASSRSSFLSPRFGHRPPSSHYSGIRYQNEDYYEDDPDGRMDLSLGQERAGGGFTGKKAKLGKLIIENEGIQMLDLVVAANMGFWWSVTQE